jgi:hypothetical protein
MASCLRPREHREELFAVDGLEITGNPSPAPRILLQNGDDFRIIQALPGHADVSTTMR